MKENNIPKYVFVKRSIVSSIDNGIYKSGQLIPSERELMNHYNVSRITVRKALAELENESYLYSVQGKGTYVKGDQNKQNLFSLTSCTQDIIRLGMTPSRKLLSAEIIKSDAKRQELLNLNDGENVYKLRRVYLADNEPINYTTTYLPYKYVKGIEDFDFSKVSLYDVIENKFGIKIINATRTVSAVSSSDDVSEYLKIPQGVPLLLFKSTTYGKIDEKVVPIETFKCFYRSDKYNFFINQVR